ncbi:MULTISPECIES: S26 family signal peptidase [unclassified Sporosarcina]|uniref:S26 family signal peptidase n=1 Tax=unclassified Sporosarcina TaxID=2647733 RepID=UPI000C16485D|nr:MULTISPECIES: S26 family signal peptidase [unclassified Sporosarcina]PID05416.1 signal peptidase I [Sporosarcina sp. P30]PID08611.1 signal peptidase I [Sporosarcina sp. P31]PID11613.1 signal peptidase I [Sporosarcina sp. P32b]
MNDFKRKLDQMMGDTTEQERRIKQRVHENLQPSQRRQFSWQALLVTAALPVVALLLVFNFVSDSQLSADQGPGTPYDPLDDMALISALQKKDQLSAIDYEEFSSLPVVRKVDGLLYVDDESFSLQWSPDTYHPVIERKADLYDASVYDPGDVVRTFTNTNSHLPTYTGVYYEVVAVPGDRVVLQNGKLKVNGNELSSELMDRYKEQHVTIAGGYDQLLNAREYLLLNHFPAKDTVQGATITPIHKIYGKLIGVATEEKTESIYIDYLTDQLKSDYTPEQYFDLYLYDQLTGLNKLPESAVFAQSSRIGELFLEASYRKAIPIANDKVEIRYQYDREGVVEQVFTMGRDTSSGQWIVEK